MVAGWVGIPKLFLGFFFFNKKYKIYIVTVKLSQRREKNPRRPLDATTIKLLTKGQHKSKEHQIWSVRTTFSSLLKFPSLLFVSQ